MRQKGLGHVVMPAPPRARLIVTHPEFALGLFQGRLYWPAQPTDTHEGGGWAGGGGIGEEVFDLFGPVQAPPQNEPPGEARAAPARAGHPHAGKVGFDRAFAPLFNRGAPPSASRQPRGDLARLYRFGLPSRYPRILTGAAPWPAPRRL